MDKALEELKKWLAETRDQPLEAMDAFFDVRIGQYEEHMSPWQQHYAWMADLLPDGIDTLLDIGCGSGLELDHIFQRFPYLHVTAIDLSREMLAKLRKKHEGRHLTLVRGDYFKHEFGKNLFDAAVSFETLHHFPAEQKQSLFARIYQGLKPGGVYLECDYIAQSLEIENLLFSECQRRKDRDGIPQDAYIHFDTPLTAEHEMQAIKAAGFWDVEVIGYLPGDANTPMLRAVKR